MHFDHYLFDLDNSLISYPDLFGFFDNILIETLKAFKKEIPKKTERDRLWIDANQYEEILKRWGVEDAVVFWKKFDSLDIKKREEYIKIGKIYVYNDVKKVLQELNDDKYKIALISNAPIHMVDFMLKQFDLSDYFHYILELNYDEHVEKEIIKPEPHGILRALEYFRFDEARHNALMIGDSETDITAAKRANIAACLIDRSKKVDTTNWEYRPDYIISNLNEILDF
ncbi:MAG: HAD-IA family hydrolase [Candidatus Lokiarchaeota archaeon]|nr:HAD-IA family hydrolase [Candidatus Lokiarchaeota archaeon]